MNTPQAIASMHELANRIFHEEDIEKMDRLKADLLAAGAIVGLLQQSPEAWFKGQPPDSAGPSNSEIDKQIAARIAARKSKDFTEADRIRGALAAQGVILEDGPGGTTWRRQ
ncbi:MAG TPA: DALR domain-containing protein [Alphaproteobacteria bacterium]|nr:DALR domain-containing protein [Alphaproteobacteria bacterium]